MKPFNEHIGKVLPLDKANIDTDQILPKQFLKRIQRNGYEEFLFYNWRYDEDGETETDFILNHEKYRDATILLTRSNFGSGSSREHAVWALENYGFRVIIAPSFADIFYNNCFNNGVLPIVLSEKKVELLFKKTQNIKGYALTVQLEKSLLYDNEEINYQFEIDPIQKERLLKGLDSISETLNNAKQIEKYESTLPQWYSMRNP